MDKKKNFSFENAPLYLQQYEIIMMRTVKSIEKIAEIISTIQNIDKQQSANNDKKSQLYSQLKSSLESLE